MKIGIVWEGGAFRTIFSEGVNAALYEAGISFDYAVGVSAGIAYGVSFLAGQPGRNLQILRSYANDPRYMGKRNLADPTNRCYFGLHFAYETIPQQLIPFDYGAFAAWPGLAEAVVTDLRTGGALYFPVQRDQRSSKLLQATCSLPLLFPIVRLDGAPCLDGGVADPIPFRRALDQGCDKLVVVLTRERGYWKERGNTSRLVERTYRRYPQFCRAMHDQAENYNRCRRDLMELEREGRAFLFAPESTAGFHRLERDMDKVQKLYGHGYAAAKERMADLRAFLA